MSKVYEEFLVYDLENTGEKTKLSINQEELQNHLNPDQVLIIIREDLRRIFIWKGSKSPVRKRFISSRVAQELQKELTSDPKYHRCKIVSIDQGDELQEFLNAFKLESMKVEERLPDMRYIRNIERERIKEAERLFKDESFAQIEEEYYSLGLEDNNNDIVISSFAGVSPIKNPQSITQKQKPLIYSRTVEGSPELSREEKEKLKDKILNMEIPEDYERQNLILGHDLYGAVSKVTEVFGESVVDTVWEEVKNLPKGIMELDNKKLRVYFDEKKGIVEAVEVLKPKNSAEKNNGEVKKTHSRRPLPKIPSDTD
jgi:hypothetical protein